MQFGAYDMNYVELGNTGLKVSNICFGSLVIGPLQANLSIDEGAMVIARAFELGINFIDTAELYGTYPYIKKAIKSTGFKPIVASKSYAYSREQASISLEKARTELDMEVIDIFMLHEQETALTMRGHREALEYYLEAKARGLIKAVGVSTHNIEVVDVASKMPEIDIIHPLINKAGIGIGDGSISQMLEAVNTAYKNGKGIYSMKALGGGNLLHSFDHCIRFVLDIPYIHSIAVGMQSIEEVEMNINIFIGDKVSEDVLEKVRRKKRNLHIDYWCEACGKCVRKCKQNALKISDKSLVVDRDKCVLCGYCAGVCPLFAIKVV
jgi:uncharacterized protein